MASTTSQFESNGFLQQQGNNSSLLRLGSMSLPRQMSRQMSIYSLTLDEFQNALGEPGKNFGSMNMDELLKNIWTAEESQAMAAALFSTTTPNENSGTNGLTSQPSIQRQNSLTLLPLPQELSKKTVDEVWRDLSPVPEFGGGTTQPVQPMKQRQGTYGEMTLEDFLIKAGVMAPDTLLPEQQQPSYYGTTANGVTSTGFPSTTRVHNIQQQQQTNGIQPILGGMTGLLPSGGKKEPMELNDPILGMGLGPSGLTTTNGYVTYNNASAAAQAAKQQADWMESQYKNSTTLAQQQQQQLMHLAAAGYMNGTNGGVGPIVTKEGSPGSPLSDAQYGGLSSGNGNLGGFEGPLRGRKRILDAPLEKIVERRQRRMIKNRESAARSRARKQAYTVELEAEVTQLKEENMRLRKMQEEENVKRKKQQVLEVIAPMTRHLPKMLRRTVTGPW